MGELQSLWPSAPLTLLARFGVGGREKLGFRPQQTLRAVLARHLFFHVEAVLARLREAEEAQRVFRLPPSSFAVQRTPKNHSHAIFFSNFFYFFHVFTKKMRVISTYFFFNNFSIFFNFLKIIM